MFERRFVEYALELAKRQGLNQLQFVRQVWPLKTDAAATTTIIALKRQNSRGKQQNLRVSDAIRMAEVLGREYPSMCFEVWEQIKMFPEKPVPKPLPPNPAKTGALAGGCAKLLEGYPEQV